MDHDNTGGVISDGCVDCGHNHCDFDLIIHLPHNFEERYTCIIIIAQLYMRLLCYHNSIYYSICIHGVYTG